MRQPIQPVFLLPIPEGIINGEGIPGWNDGLKPEFLDDVGFIESMILSRLTAQYSVDNTQLFMLRVCPMEVV